MHVYKCHFAYEPAGNGAKCQRREPALRSVMIKKIFHIRHPSECEWNTPGLECLDS